MSVSILFMSRKYHHGDLRAALMDAALQILDQEGPDGVTIRAVARLAKVSHAAPVNHFADRRSLLTALATCLFQDLGNHIRKGLEKTPAKGSARVRSFADRLIEFGLTSPNRYKLLWRRDLLNNEEPELLSAMDEIYNSLTANLTDLVRKPRHDVDTQAIALWSMVHGYLSLRIDGLFEPRADQLSGEPRERAIVSALIDSLVKAH